VLSTQVDFSLRNQNFILTHLIVSCKIVFCEIEAKNMCNWQTKTTFFIKIGNSIIYPKYQTDNFLDIAGLVDRN